MTTALLDANVLIALTVVEHEHHERASSWITVVERFAVCPIVEGALVRFLVRVGESADSATALVRAVRDHPGCEFWADSVSYGDVDLRSVRGHRQVTDAYLIGLARAMGGVLATLDEGIAAVYPDSVALLPPV